MAFFVLNDKEITPSGIILIGDISNNRRGNAIANLSRKQCGSSSLGLDDSFKIVEEKIKPTCSSEIINEMTNTISPDFNLVQIIESVLFGH